MRVCALGLLVLAGCASPFGPFDSGHEVHFILRSDPLPDRDIHLEAVCTVGPLVAKSRPETFGPAEPAAREVAVIRAPTGQQRISIWIPRLGTRARGTYTVEHETWVVMQIARGSKRGRTRAYKAPPAESVGGWVPLVAVPR
ncbi:MAG: hypothetical protein ACYTGV_02570 [Planctomycetota bacterium]|jgi:hypothetical protein